MKDAASQNQFGFIAGKRIHDCIAIASDVVNCLNQRAFGGNMALKVDIRKSFDTVSWDFIFNVRQAFGFSSLFTTWVKLLFESAHISILVNGRPFG